MFELLRLSEFPRQSQIDFSALSQGLIEGGADSLYQKFNIRVPGLYNEARSRLERMISSPNISVRELRAKPLGKDWEEFGVYFEARPKTHKLLASGTSEITSENRQLAPAGYSPNKIKWYSRIFSKEPAFKGVIVIHNYNSNALGSVYECAVASRMDSSEKFEFLTEINREANGYKAFHTAFFTDKPKKVIGKLDPKHVESLHGHISSLGLNVRTEQSPLKIIKDLELELGFEPYYLGPEDSGYGYSVTAPFNFKKEDSPEYVWGGMHVNDGEDSLNVYCDEFDKHNYDIVLRSMNNPRLISLFLAALNKLHDKKATTQVSAHYGSLFQDMKDVYLPNFPLACKTAISMQYPYDLSTLGKD